MCSYASAAQPCLPTAFQEWVSSGPFCRWTNWGSTEWRPFAHRTCWWYIRIWTQNHMYSKGTLQPSGSHRALPSVPRPPHLWGGKLWVRWGRWGMWWGIRVGLLLILRWVPCMGSSREEEKKKQRRNNWGERAREVPGPHVCIYATLIVC